MKKSEKNNPSGIYSSNLTFIFSHLDLKVWEIVLFFFMITVIAILSTAFPLFTKIIIDQYIPNSDIDGIFYVFFIACVLLFVLLIIEIGAKKIFQKVIAQQVALKLQIKAMKKFQTLRQTTLDKLSDGVCYAKFYLSINKILDFLTNFVLTVFESIILILWVSIIIIIINYKIFLFIFFLSLFFIFIKSIFKKPIEKNQNLVRENKESLSKAINNFINNNYMARIHGEEFFEYRKIDYEGLKLLSKQKKLIMYANSYGAFVSCINQLFILIMVAFTASFVMRGEQNLGDLTLIALYGAVSLNSVVTIYNNLPKIAEFKDSCEALKEILNLPEEENLKRNKKLQSYKGSINIKNMSFTYPDNHQATLNDINLDIPSNTSIGLVGRSGSGKTTLVHLILGLYEPTKGFIFYDDIKGKELNLASVRNFFGVITQKPTILWRTVKENIAHGDKNANDEDVIQAARQANIYHKIISLPQGFDAFLGEKGNNLSGGEKQRISIARALYRKPKVLVMDEATSALDTDSEKKIQNSIQKTIGEQTTIIIAHKLSTIFKVDKIVVLEKGSVAEQGNHNELIDKKGIYASLLAEQFKVSIKDLEVFKLPDSTWKKQ